MLLHWATGPDWVFFLVSFNFGVRSFTLLMEMIMSWNPSKLYKWFHCIWVLLFSWINHTDVTNESFSVLQIFIHRMWHFCSFCTILNVVFKSVLLFLCIKNESPSLKFWYHFWHWNLLFFKSMREFSYKISKAYKLCHATKKTSSQILV